MFRLSSPSPSPPSSPSPCPRPHPSLSLFLHSPPLPPASPHRLPVVEAPKVSSQVLTETKEEFLRGFAKLFNSEQYSDVTLFLGPGKVKFHAHYPILGVRTSYFDKAKEHGFKEGETNEYHFPDYSAHALWRVLQYFYTGDYSAEPNQIDDSGDDDLELVKHPKVYAVADLLDLEALKKLCLVKFEEQLDQHWISETFTDSVREVYGTTYSNDRTMKDPLIKIVRQNGKALFARPEFVKLTKEVAEFSADILASIFFQITVFTD